MKIIYCGDVVGRSGREAVLNNLEKLRENYKPDVIVVNVENAAHGFGVTPGICRDFLNNGVNMLVTGNHVWQQRELIPFLNESKQIVRPLNYPEALPGRGAAEIELDKETGEISVVDYAACVDCGTPINPNLTRVQAEGGLLQGIGMALTENVTYDEKGVLAENSFLQYKIPTRVDVGRIRVEFDCSYEDAGPFGAKSIGEVVINTPLPAIADAVYNATGKRFFELPITPEMVVME